MADSWGSLFLVGIGWLVQLQSVAEVIVMIEVCFNALRFDDCCSLLLQGLVELLHCWSLGS